MNNDFKSLSFDELLKLPMRCLELANLICKEQLIAGECLRMTDGSQLVYSCGEGYIIKIFSPDDVEYFHTETVYLKNLHGRLSIPTPGFLVSGYYGRFPYIIMEKLKGVPLKQVWQTISHGERGGLLERLGRAVRELHELPVNDFAAGSFGWEPFIRNQSSNLVANHRNFKLDDKWLSQLPRFMEPVPAHFFEPTSAAPLHTELMLEHVFVHPATSTTQPDETAGQWDITGLIDFEPAMVGHPLYDFCAVGLFITPGEPELFRLFLSAYGYHHRQLNPQLSREIMKMFLLHRYCNLTRFFTLLPEHMVFDTFEQLEQYWFGL